MKDLMCLFWIHQEIYRDYEIITSINPLTNKKFDKRIYFTRCVNCNKLVRPKKWQEVIIYNWLIK